VTILHHQPLNHYNHTDFSSQPKPIESRCAFKYDRKWKSLGKDVRGEMSRYFAKDDFRKLQRPTLNMTEGELRALHDKYFDEGENELFRARWVAMNQPFSPKIFGAVSAHLVS
jgi:hypothetical protein